LLKADKLPTGFGILFDQLLAPCGNGLGTLRHPLVLLGLFMGDLLSHVSDTAVWLIAARERGENDADGAEHEKTYHGAPFS